jgi:transcriptional regulator with XRE-family HTH domain
MKLETYLKEKKMTDDAFAALVGLSQSQISRIRRDKSWPTREAMERIATATAGVVTANDFLSIDIPVRRKPARAKHTEAAE